MIEGKILNFLRKNKDIYISGEMLSEKCGISRVAVWKHIRRLKKMGYVIDAISHKGYRLLRASDKMLPYEIQNNLRTEIFGKEIFFYDSVASTNDTAYALAENGAKEGAVVIAEHQSKGKGRFNRIWISPKQTGIYFSCVLRPKMPLKEVPKITILVAVAVAESISKTTGLNIKIKWPNDVMINDHKVSGILTELKAEQDEVDFVILGLGINVNTPKNVLPSHATSISCENGKPVDRVALMRMILEKIEQYYKEVFKRGHFNDIIKKWKQYSYPMGSKVRINLHHKKIIEGSFHSLSSDGTLLVKLTDGNIKEISAGDVEIVKQKND